MSTLIETTKRLWQPMTKDTEAAVADQVVDTREFLQSMLTLSRLLEKQRAHKEVVF